ncbi:hypothetical protein [Zymomonas mobilis]|uniref:hypothetical protein n=1 Tax=Zymomonas mobilis TaxID=542 RepID=UPI0039E84E5F
MRILLSALTALAVVTTTAAPAFSAACRDGRGRFVKCDARRPLPPKRCRDNRGKFAKCDLGRDGDRRGPRDDRGPDNRGR